MTTETSDQPQTSAIETDGGSKSRRGHVQDEVLDTLRNGLMAGAFAPGTVLSLRKLAAALDTSPMPVRRALGQLVAAQVLEEAPNRSVRVPYLSDRRLTELFEVRELIEGKATRAAAANSSPALVEELTDINAHLVRAIERRDIQGTLSSNQRFHFALYRAAESEVLMPLIESLWLQCGPTMYSSFLSPEGPWDASAHFVILDALRIQNIEQAHDALTGEIRSTVQVLRSNSQAQRRPGPYGDLAITIG